MHIERLDWDSNFFGYEVGQVHIPKKNLIDSSDFYKEAQKFKLVYIFSDQEQNIEKLNLVDLKTTLSQTLAKAIKSNNESANLENFNKELHDFDQLRRLALMSGRYSRFNIDKNFINKEFEKLYTRWIKNAVEDKSSDNVIVYLDENKIIGLTTLGEKNKNLADIGLVAVDSVARGKGVGSALIYKSLKIAKIKGYSEIQVVTQNSNKPALQLYKKCGFSITGLTYVYHYWNL